MINNNELISINNYFEPPLTAYWFLSSKIQLVSRSISFSQTSSLDLLCRKQKKDGNHLVQNLVNMADEVEQTRLNLIFFPGWFLLNVALCYHREAKNFSYWWEWAIFLDFYAQYAAALSVWLLFKNWKGIILRLFHHTHSISFLLWSCAFGIGGGDLSLSIHSPLHWTLS